MPPISTVPSNTIVVASANIFRRELILFQLDEAGYRVAEACDTATLQQMLRTIQPALLILDLLMPDLEQVTLARRAAQQMPALILLTNDPRNIPRQWLSWGSRSATLPWPHEQPDLLRAVQHMVPVVAHAPLA